MIQTIYKCAQYDDNVEYTEYADAIIEKIKYY